MNPFKRFSVCVLTALCIPALAQATTLIKMSTEQMTARASDIVIGTVTEVRSTWVDRRLITLATISVSESLKGAARKELTLVLPGGVDATRAVPVAVTYPGAPVVMPADNVLLFLEGAAPLSDGFQVVGFSQGKYSIVRDAFGRSLASPSRAVGAEAVDLATFKSRVRELGASEHQSGRNREMNTKRQLVVAAFAAAVLLGGTAHGGGSLDTADITAMNVTVPGSVDGRLIPIKWDARCIPVNYTLDSTPPNALTFPAQTVDINTTRAELQTAMEQWNQIRTSFIRLNITAVSDLNGGALTPPGAIGAFDFINELNFVTQGGFLAAAPSVSLIEDTTLSAGQDVDLDGDSDVFPPSNANGRTCRDFDGDGDIEFPAGFYKAGTILENDVGFAATNGVPWNTTPDNAITADIQGVAVHELGHSHGLAHSLINQLSKTDGSGATMYPFIDINDPGGEESQRSPAVDDVAWSSFLYPEGSVSSGPGALQAGDRRFRDEYGLVKGEVTSGTLGGPVAGANVWVQDAHTGEVLVSGYSGTAQVLIVPGPTGITDFDAGFFFGPTAEFSILNGDYVIPVPAGRYTVGLQSLDGVPASPGNISNTAIVGGAFTDLAFQEEFWNGPFEGATEVRPGDALPVQVRNGRETRHIDFETNVTNELRNTDGVFDANDPFGFTAAPAGRMYAVRFANADVQAFIAAGSVLHTGLFLTDVADASAPVSFRSATLTTGRLNADGTAAIDMNSLLQKQSPFLAQDTDFAPMYFKLPTILTLFVKQLLEHKPDTDLFLVLEVPNAPFPGFSGLPPLIGLDSETAGDSFRSDDGGVTFVPEPNPFNYFFELVARP